MRDPREPRWLLLIHQLPPTPAYLRVKIARRLQHIGAVALKNSVYVLPGGAERLEDFQWTVREITDGGGEATVCEAGFVEGPTDAEVEALFRESRRSDYAAIVAEARDLLGGSADAAMKAESRRALEHGLARVNRRLSAVRTIDFFGAPGAAEAVDLVARLSSRLRDPAGSAAAASTTLDPTSFRGRTWVTREDVHVDRMASAWLIRKFIDAEARFKFVPARTYQPSTGELRFDMFEAEFTHEGGQCTFEVLLGRTGSADPALRPIAEIVHDIDLKDGKFARPETAGIAAVISSIAAAHRDDGDRVARAEALFDDLHAWYRTRAGGR